jgi:hypothetical protein
MGNASSRARRFVSVALDESSGLLSDLSEAS